MINIIKQYALAAIYSSVLLILFIGTQNATNENFSSYYLLHLVPYLLMYFIGVKLFSMNRISFKKYYEIPIEYFKTKNVNYLAVGVGLIALYITSHFIHLGGVPIIQAFGEDLTKFTKIRINITKDSHFFFNYMSSFFFYTVLPFTIVYTFIKKEKLLHFIVVFISLFYALALMQRAYTLIVIFPILAYTFLNKKFIHHAIILAFTATSLYLAFILPDLGGNKYIGKAPSQTVVEEVVVEKPKIINPDAGTSFSPFTILDRLRYRILDALGGDAYKWLNIIPEQLPYLGLDGYRIASYFTGRKYIDYSKEVYKLVEPDMVAQGIVGSSGTAAFVYEYASWGKTGLVVSGIVFGLFMAFVTSLYVNISWTLLISINTYYILEMAYSPFSKTLFSGGWILMIIFAQLFLDKDKNELARS